MAKKPRARTERRAEERAEQKRVRDRERLAALLPGASERNPIEVPAASVIEGRVHSTPCPRCGGELRVEAHRAPLLGKRALDVRCQSCAGGRTMWFQIVGFGAS